MGAETDSERARFERGDLDPTTFRHADHLRLAFEMLSEQGFLAMLPRYAGAIKEMARRAGRPEAYNETITTAFLSMIAERLATGSDGYDAFAAANADLFRRDWLARFYSPERLRSPLARSTFLLPDRSGSAGHDAA